MSGARASRSPTAWAPTSVPSGRHQATDHARQSDEQIRQAYIDKYGDSILLAPQDSGVSLLVWILPVVVVALGATGIVFALRRNRDEPHLHATDADERLVQREHRVEDTVDG